MRLAVKVDEEFLKGVVDKAGFDSEGMSWTGAFGDNDVVYLLIEVVGSTKIMIEIITEEQMLEEFKKDPTLEVMR